MKFCTQCDNMYYIGIDEKDSNQLTYYCRNCKNTDNSIASEGACIIDTHSGNTSMEYSHNINEYTKMDPTLPRVYNIKCPNADCKTNEVDTKDYKFPEIIYMRYDNANMKYVYICTHCDTIWKTNEEI